MNTHLFPLKLIQFNLFAGLNTVINCTLLYHCALKCQLEIKMAQWKLNATRIDEQRIRINFII